MALTRLDLSAQVCIEDCANLKFSDTTGFLVTSCADDYNLNGYGLSGGIDVNDVTSSELNVYYPNMDVAYKFNFTIVNGLVTAATLTDINLIVVDIFPFLISKVFPFVDFDLNLLAYTVIYPSISDGIVKWDYSIIGQSGVENFGYTTSDEFLNDCNINCCITNSYTDVDLTCKCYKDKIKNIQLSEFFVKAAQYAMSTGNDGKTNGYLSMANELCKGNCKTC